MKDDDYYYYKGQTVHLLVRLRDWLRMMNEIKIDATDDPLTSEIQLANQLFSELREHYHHDEDVPGIDDDWSGPTRER